ncbi:D-isomer specific 2-hydroxyacid dehydrogenase family protein [Saccharopolyspora hattusasensis]|uniref:D-isomer specific 2-hydroxyacid dehydrogenase family protein n=1 Tax=Saccharopolyspora hattusasensis TaxID=1128679 RepID=UPI003D981FD2
MQVHIGPIAPPELTAAVVAAGAEISPAAEATALVWYGEGPERFAEFDHPGLEWVQLPSAGIEAWAAADALRDGITFTSAAGTYAQTVAEHTLGLMLVGARRLHVMARAENWARPTGMLSLFGATVGIIGAGGIGRVLIDLLQPFGVRVLAVNRSGKPVAGAAWTWPADDEAGMDRLLAESDFVVVAAPATAETAKLIDADALSRMKAGAWLINVARGSLVDTEALVEALDAERIGGAALDVTDPEPLPDGHPLFQHPRAIISPHSANPKSLLVPALARRVEDNVRRRLAGQPLLGVIDRTAGY